MRGKYFIEDLESRNKTFVNNKELAPRTQTDSRKTTASRSATSCARFTIPWRSRCLRTCADEPEEPADDPLGSTTVEAMIGRVASNVLLETQPAEKLNALLDILANLSQTLELDPLLPKIVDTMFTMFKQADRAFIILSDPATKRLIPKVIKTRRQLDETNARFSRKIVNQSIENVAGVPQRRCHQ